jgi:UDP-glucuronate decarboxylase
VAGRDVAPTASLRFDGTPREPVFRGAPAAVPAVKVLDIGKARERLGWKPTLGLEEGLDETLAWYRGSLEAKGAERD